MESGRGLRKSGDACPVGPCVRFSLAFSNSNPGDGCVNGVVVRRQRPVTWALLMGLAVWLALLVVPSVWAQAPPGGNEPGVRGGATMPGGGIEPPGEGAAPSERLIPARAPKSPGTGTVAFFLVVVLCLFGFHLFTSNALNSRIDRLEQLARKASGALGDNELVPFSWDAILRTLEGGSPFLPGLSLPRPGLVLLGVSQPELGPILLTNIAHGVLQDPELVVLAVTRSLGADELGRRLLSLETGRDWRTLGPEARRSLLQGTARRLQRYERSLFCTTDLALAPHQLYEACQALRKEAELGAILLDDPGMLVGDPDQPDVSILDYLRLLAVRCHVPIHLVVPLDSPVWQAREDADLFLVVAEVKPVVEGQVRICFQKFPGLFPELALHLDAVSGRLEAPPVSVAGA